jgi:photosystem II stability/assembly factor-like uncharacterized protein
MQSRAIVALAGVFGLGLLSACSGGAPPKPPPSQDPLLKTAPATPASADTSLRGLDAVDGRTVFAFGVVSGADPQNIVVKSIDGGATWAVVLRVAGKDVEGSPASDLKSIDFTDAQNGVAMDEDGAVYATADGGATWTVTYGGQMTKRFPPPDDDDENVPELSGVYFAGARNGWAVGVGEVSSGEGKSNEKRESPAYRPVVLRSTDGGATWKRAQVDAGATAASLQNVVFATPQDGWAVGGDPEIEDPPQSDVLVRTKNGGASWQAVAVKTGLVLTDVAFVDATRGVLVGAKAEAGAETEIFTTKDGGATWQSTGKAPAALYALRFADAQTGWAVGANGTVLTTGDGGATWTGTKLGDLSSGGVSLARPRPVGASEDEQSAFFYEIALLEPGRGWAATDEGVFEYRKK